MELATQDVELESESNEECTEFRYIQQGNWAGI